MPVTVARFRNSLGNLATSEKDVGQERQRRPHDFWQRASISPLDRRPRTAENHPDVQDSRPILDRLPVGILVYRLNTLIYANRAFLDVDRVATLDALNEAGGLDSLFIERRANSSDSRNGAKSLTIATVNGTQKPVEGRLFSAVWNKENALVL